MTKTICTILVLFIALTQTVYSQPLTPLEEKIKNHVVQSKPAQVKLLKQLVNINSGTNHVAGVHRVGNIVKKELDQLGFKTYWVKLPAYMHHANTLVAKRTGVGKKILVIGHLDTVFAKNSSFQRFTLLNKHTAKGPGAIDDKGGVVVMLYALKALAAEKALDNTSITIVLTGDEEDSGKPSNISRKPLIEAAKGMDIALDFEPGVTGTISIARRGVTNWAIKVKGNESHSATIFQKEVGAGAIFELARILNTVRTTMHFDENITFNPGIVLAGTKVTYGYTSEGRAFGKQNVVAKTAIAEGDIRYSSPEEQSKLENDLRKIVNKHLPETDATIKFINGIPSMPVTSQSRLLLKTYSDISKQLGFGAIEEYPANKRGAGDISHVAALVPAKLVGLGPTGADMHSIKETIDLDSLPVQTQRVAILIYRLTR